jgi:hypothetical protein
LLDDQLAVLDQDGWLRLPNLLPPHLATGIAVRADGVITAGEDPWPGDRSSSGIRHMGNLLERMPGLADHLAHPTIDAAVGRLLGPHPHLDLSYRSPRPGYGGQQLHTDDVLLAAGQPWQALVAIVALCDFTEDNGATGIIPGSHRRPDLQRLAGRLEHHCDERTLTGPAGTAFVLSGHLLHRGRPNQSTHDRPALQAVWRRSGRAGGEVAELGGGGDVGA